MSTAARKRLMRDFKRLQNDPPAGVSGSPLDNNVMIWQAVIFGPDETPWEGGTFRLLLEFTEDYPNKPPAVRFLSKIFHPNVYNDGKICLDILQNQWSPIYDIAAILTSIQSLLSDPNPASPANAEASTLYERDRREYNKRVRTVVEASWMDDEDGMTMDADVSSSGGDGAAEGADTDAAGVETSTFEAGDAATSSSVAAGTVFASSEESALAQAANAAAVPSTELESATRMDEQAV